MKVLKGALLLLLLAVANAKPDHDHDHDHNNNHTDQKPADPDNCQVPKMLARDDMQQILGDWVLVWAVSDHQESRDILKNLSSSHVEMRLQEDNQTLTFSERNRFSDNKCINYYINISMELLHNPKHTMHPIEGNDLDGEIPAELQ
ncbi:Saxitoxin and tetrodotoxin-binding protein 1 [Dissostichus eleginoides]|uniref:Saxitoxin and tetrodotoxin-binding protein 1 n=1 Tax=Dissostichus eleginoides TaxID=100907 RepID=A0AAD9EZ76_DISEL|nr:Saxitoxin and tetrodotoxin-binding protein 1 [Dissostichus eleginoides]